MFNGSSTTTVIRCTFANNWDYDGMFNERSSVTVIECKFSGGRGMYNENCYPPGVTIRDTLFDGCALERPYNGTSTGQCESLRIY